MARRRCLLGIAFMTGLILLGGCSGGAAEGAGQVEYRRSGGLAGVEMILYISPQGQARLERDGEVTEWQVPEERLAEVYRRLESLDTSQIPEPGTVGQARDVFEYQVTYGGQTWRARDTQVPEVLVPVLEILAQTAAQGPPAE